MAGEWPKVTIESLLESGAITGHKDGNHGSDYPRVEEFGTSGVPFLTVKSLSEGRLDVDRAPRFADDKADRLHFGFLKPGDVLLSHNATIGRVGIVPDFTGRLLIGTSLTYFRLDDSRIFPRYLAAYFSGADFQNQLAAVMSHTTRNQIPITAQRQLQIVLPPLAEQKAIAAVLGALDDKIELNRRMNATLEATARALFQSWFVDFDPVRAKLDGRKPDRLDKSTAALFPAAFQDSPLGPIPKGWAVARLDDIASVMMGLSPDGDSYNSDGVGVPLINGPMEFGDYFPVKTKWTQASTRFAAEGDLIFCVRGSTTGRRVVSDGEYGIGRGVCAIRAKDRLDSLLYQTINVGLERLLEKTTGSVFPSLSAPDIKGFSVLKPNGDVQQLYERTTKPMLQSIQQNHRQSHTLATLRDTLLPKLLSGEISPAGTSSAKHTKHSGETSA